MFAPNQAVTRLEGELVQRGAPRFTLGGRHSRLRNRGLRLRLSASDQGMRTQPLPPRADFDVAGRFAVAR